MNNLRKRRNLTPAQALAEQLRHVLGPHTLKQLYAMSADPEQLAALRAAMAPQILVLDPSFVPEASHAPPARSRQALVCRGCGQMLRPENMHVADGCQCAAPRGINHGVVAAETCACAECDPGQARHPAP